MPCTKENIFFRVLIWLAMLTSSLQQQNPESIQILTFDEFSNSTLLIYQNGILNSAWNKSLSQGNYTNCCGRQSFPIEMNLTQTRKFTLKNLGSETIIIQNIQIDTFKDILDTITTEVPLEIIPQKEENIIINYVCRQEDILKNRLDGWSPVSISLKTANNTLIEFGYLKICTLDNKDGVDWSMFVLFILATLVISIGSQQNYSLNVDAASHEEQFKSIHYIIFAFLTSGALITLYFFNEVAGFILGILFSISAITVLTILLSEFLESYTSGCKLCHRKYDLRCFGNFSLPEIFSFFGAIALVSSWFITRHWIFNNLIGCGLVIIILKAVKISSFKTISILLTVCFCYDIFWVFISKMIFGQSVMMANVSSTDIPIKLEWPYFMTMPIPMCSILGLGDLVFPGFLITFNYRYGLQKKTLSYYCGSIIAYTLSLFACGIIMAETGNEQPALLYIVPSLLLSTIMISAKRKEFKEIWEGIEDDYQYHNMKDLANCSESYHIKLNVNDESTN